MEPLHTSRKHLFCFGLGRSARTLGRLLLREGWAVSGTVRSPEKSSALEEQGFPAFPFDDTRSNSPLAHAISTATHILVSVPPDHDGDPCLRYHQSSLQCAQSLTWIGYLSTIGVYGDHAGAWIDEDTPPSPTSLRGKARLQAETAWTSLASDMAVPLAILRISGIYGPGRNVLLDLEAGTAHRIIKNGQVFNRIHSDDLVSAIRGSIRHPPQRHRVYNLCDNEPAPPQDVVTFAARLLNRPPPPEILFADAPLSPMARSFYSENKRCRNRRMRDELGIQLTYPTYREGLRGLLSHPDPDA